MLLFAVFSIVSMTGSIWSHDSEITEFAGHSFPQRDLTKIIVKNGKLHGEQEDPKLSFCAPYCIDGSCPPAPAANKPTCDDPPGVCIILCDGDADCQEDAICINTGKAGVCAFNTTES
ncbi:hypothetical protein FOL47_007266 [Perkinsus chesapeaki]|uniref:Uncharacterized protein n=1 Tax=Perkinsus chesapeaki TaxID=330153 RepID=A0A7J6LMT3_PERCH|nr:hypothetical protein FOL47_007266 [Perkinsus chesapeaki]